jgi:hypothetical protein
MIDIKSVKSISYDFCCLNKNGLLPTYYSFLACSQLTTSIHLHCYCTVHTDVVIHFFDSMWSFEWKRICVGFFIVSLKCIYIAVGDPVIKSGGLGSHQPV